MNAQQTTADLIHEYMDRGSYEAGTRAALEAVGATLTIRKGSGKPCAFGDTRMEHYRFTIKSAAGSYSSDFWQSVAGSMAGKVPTEYDVLACLQWYCDHDSAAEFAKEYGYTNDKEAMRTYKACKRQADALGRLFAVEQLETLSAVR